MKFLHCVVSAQHSSDRNLPPNLTVIEISVESDFNSALVLRLAKWCEMVAQPATMLQKLSKCEVKAWLCWNLIILLLLRFYMKSHFGKFKRTKNVIFGKFRDSELWNLVNLRLESCSNLLKIKIQNL